MNIKEMILLIILVCGAIYNFDNSILRLLAIFIWGILPFFILIFINNTLMTRNIIKEVLLSLSIVLLLLISFISNIQTLNFGLSGSNSEQLTPFLYISFLIIYIYFLQIKESITNKKIILYFFIIVTCILFLDMLVRYVQDPSLFLNYNHRQSAKNLGFFNNTNIVGQIISFILVLSWFIKFQFKRTIQIILGLILFTTMARSAIVALIIVYAINIFSQTKGIKKILSYILIGFLGIFMIIDPLNLINDGSLLSKIAFFESTYNIINNGTIGDFIFGYAASIQHVTLLLDVDGHSPHVAIIKAFLYYGLLGVIIFFFILVHFIKMNSKMKMPVLVFFIFSLAGAPIFWPTLSVGLILLLINDNIERNRLNDYK